MDSDFKTAKLSNETDEQPTIEAAAVKNERFGRVEPHNFYSRENTDIPLKKNGGKKIIFFIIILVALVATGFLFRNQLKALVLGGGESAPSPSPRETVGEPSPLPSPTQNPLVRSDWSLEVLNGSGQTGLAKKYADELKDLGYPVVKTGNADKQTYKITEILVREDLKDRVDLVIADLKDTIKIATVAGELKEGTASARIILGKD